MSESVELVLPGNGVIVNLDDETEVARALSEIQDLKPKIAEADRVLRDAMDRFSKVHGTKTLHIDGVGTFTLKGGEDKHYDVEAIEKGLRRAGMPEEILNEIIKETVERKLDAVRANQAARANPKYAKVIAKNTTVVVRIPTVTIS